MWIRTSQVFLIHENPLSTLSPRGHVLGSNLHGWPLGDRFQLVESGPAWRESWLGRFCLAPLYLVGGFINVTVGWLGAPIPHLFCPLSLSCSIFWKSFGKIWMSLAYMQMSNYNTVEVCLFLFSLSLLFFLKKFKIVF